MRLYQPHRPSFFPLCGCWFIFPHHTSKQYLPQVQLESHTTVLATTSRTILRQTFVNPHTEALKEVSYTFPLYDGVSVAGFQCTVAGRVIIGVVKERSQARTDYQKAVDRGETAGLFEQNVDASDVFTTSIGNVPAGEKILIEITYLGELKNDAETDGARFTIPTQIAPRYGSMTLSNSKAHKASDNGGMKITVDVVLEEGSVIRGIQSPSHPIAVTMGRTSEQMDDDDYFENNIGSSTLALGNTELDKDFVIVIQAKGQDTPRALLETHPSLPNQRALMTTLVPKFNIPIEHPEIVFIVDRSGSMNGKMHLVVEALKVFLKSLPVGSRFDICSFGSHHSFLFKRSKTYDATSLQEAMNHIQSSQFQANYGGTEMLQPVKEVLKRRYADLPLEVMLLTDGEIWNQDELFTTVNEASQENARFFTLGIGSSASSALVEGIARSGRGFSQWVNDGERIDKRIVRMLKGALTPHIKYQLEVKYTRPASSDEEDFEIVESFEKSMKLVAENDGAESPTKSALQEKTKKVISLFNPKSKDEPTNPTTGRYDHLPKVSIPHVLQTPHIIPELYPHSRSTMYVLLGPDAPDAMPSSVILRGASKHGDLELEIEVQDVGTGTTIHELAAKKAMQELEEGRGWLTQALAKNGKTLKSQNESRFDLMVEREAVRLGTMFQVGGKFCSFVAIEKDKKKRDNIDADTEEYLELPSYQQSQNVTLDSLNSNTIARQRAVGSFVSAPGSAPSPAIYAQPQGPGSSFGPGVGVSLARAPQMKESTSSMRVGGLFGSSGSSGLLSKQKRSAPSSPLDGLLPKSNSLASAAQARPSFGGFGGSTTGGYAPPPPPAVAARRSVSAATLGYNAPVQAQQEQQASPQASLFGFGSTSRARDRNSNVQASRMDIEDECEEDAEPLSDQDVDFCMRPQSHQKDEKKSKDTESARKPSMFGFLSRQEASVEKGEKSKKMGRKSSSAAVSPSISDKSGPLNPQAEAATSLDKMQRLIGLQTFSGSWQLSNDIPGIVAQGAVLVKHVDSKESIAKFCRNSWTEILSEDAIDDLSDETFATAIAIAWLEYFMKDEEDVWEMVVGKAKGWLESKVDGSEMVEQMIEKLKVLWKSKF